MLHRLTAAAAATAVLLLHAAAASPDVPSGSVRGLERKRSAEQVIRKLNLTANVEKGYYVQTYEDPARTGNRSYSTAIYYLLEGAVGPSYWHRVDATEVWHHYAGAPLRLDTSWNNGTPTRHRFLGDDVFDGQAPQLVVDKHEWQRAQSLGNWTLVGTTVAPGFVEGGFELAAPDWQPNDKTS